MVAAVVLTAEVGEVSTAVAVVEVSAEAAAADSVVAVRRDLSVAADFLEGAPVARDPSAAGSAHRVA